MNNNEILDLKESITNFMNENIEDINPLEINEEENILNNKKFDENKWEFDKIKEENNKNKILQNSYKKNDNIHFITRYFKKVKNKDPFLFKKLIEIVNDLNMENRESLKQINDLNSKSNIKKNDLQLINEENRSNNSFSNDLELIDDNPMHNPDYNNKVDLIDDPKLKSNHSYSNNFDLIDDNSVKYKNDLENRNLEIVEKNSINNMEFSSNEFIKSTLKSSKNKDILYPEPVKKNTKKSLTKEEFKKKLTKNEDIDIFDVFNKNNNTYNEGEIKKIPINKPIVNEENIFKKSTKNQKKVDLVLESINFKKYDFEKLRKQNQIENSVTEIKENITCSKDKIKDNILEFKVLNNYGSILDIILFKFELIDINDEKIKLLSSFISVYNNELVKLKNLKDFINFDNSEFITLDYTSEDILIKVKFPNNRELKKIKILSDFNGNKSCIKTAKIILNNTDIMDFNFKMIKNKDSFCFINILNKSFDYNYLLDDDDLKWESDNIRKQNINKIILNDKNQNNFNKKQIHQSNNYDKNKINNRRQISNVKINFKKKPKNNNDILNNDILNNVLIENPIKKFEKNNNFEQCLNNTLNGTKKLITNSDDFGGNRNLKDNNILYQMILENNKEFKISELKNIDNLEINIYSTWGDKFYVGLCGIEIFDQNGKLIILNNLDLSADPADINILEEYSDDPRTIEKLIDKTYTTSDDYHQWLAPFNEFKINKIFINFSCVTSISMIRFWNYNKSRIHTTRGVQNITISNNNKLYFYGKIKKASGSIKDCYENSTEIFFKINNNIIKSIEIHDSKTNNDWIGNIEEDKKLSLTIKEINEDKRPFTKATQKNTFNFTQLKPKKVVKRKTLNLNNTNNFIECSKISIEIKETWGNSSYAGICGIEFYNENSKLINLESDNLYSNNNDLEDLGYKKSINNLINGINLTTDDQYMSLFSFDKLNKLFIYFDFGKKIKLSYIKIYNYNNQNKRNYCVKKIKIIADLNKNLTNDDYFIKQSYGSSLFDFGQIIYFPIELNKPNLNFNFIDNKEFIPGITNKFPCGFTIEINILSLYNNSNDYFGIDGLEIYDYLGKNITDISNIHFLSEIKSKNIDDLKLKKGFEGKFIKNNLEDQDMLYSTFIIDFDKVICLGLINIFNYTSYPNKGIKEFQIKMDSKTIFTGDVMKSDLNSIFFGNKILFKNNKTKEIIINKEEQNVLFYNEN